MTHIRFLAVTGIRFWMLGSKHLRALQGVEVGTGVAGDSATDARCLAHIMGFQPIAARWSQLDQCWNVLVIDEDRDRDRTWLVEQQVEERLGLRAPLFRCLDEGTTPAVRQHLDGWL